MNDLIKLALDKPGSVTWLISRTVDDAREAFRAARIDLAENVRRISPNERMLVLNNGSSITFKWYDMESLYSASRGVVLDAVKLDGVYLLPDEMPYVGLRATTQIL